MENLKQVYFTKSKNILFWLLCLTFIGMFLPTRFSNITLIALMIFCVSKIRLKQNAQLIKKDIAALVLISLYLLYIIGLLYTTNLKAGMFQLERKIAFVLFPVLVLPLVIREQLDIRYLLKQVGLITFASSFLMLIVASYQTWILGLPDAFYFETLTPIHYVAYSMYFACGSLFLINALFDDLTGWRRTIVLAAIFIYALTILILVAAKTGIIIFILCSILFFYMKFHDRKVFWSCLILFISLAVALLYFNKTTASRFTELDKYLSVLTQQGPIKDVEVTDLNMRLLFWKISVSHAWKDGVWLTGVGPGDAQDYLDALYTLPDYMLFGYVGWNSHNQWIYFFIQLGIAPLLIFGLYYKVYLIKSFRTYDFNLLCFLLITLAFSLSECFLERNKGIVFFAFMLSVLSVSNGDKPGNQIKTTSNRTDGPKKSL